MYDHIDKALDDLPNGKANLRVHLVVPQTGDNPWRTKDDYIQEQKEARERHAMLQEQHRLLAKSIRWNIILASATVVLAIATVVLVFVTIY